MDKISIRIKTIEHEFSICKLKDYSKVNIDDPFTFVQNTDEEKSLVCITSKAPSNVIAKEDDYKAFRIQGPLDFSLIGILANLTKILSDNNIGLFAISTYNTDYILVKKNNYKKALNVLHNAGYEIT